MFDSLARFTCVAYLGSCQFAYSAAYYTLRAAYRHACLAHDNARDKDRLDWLDRHRQSCYAVSKPAYRGSGGFLYDYEHSGFSVTRGLEYPSPREAIDGAMREWEGY
jgi:hypothetical protein